MYVSQKDGVERDCPLRERAVLSRRQGNPFHPLKKADDPLRSLLFASLCVYQPHGPPNMSTVSGNRLRECYHGRFRFHCPAPQFHTGYESQWAVCGCVRLYTRKFLSDMLAGEGPPLCRRIVTPFSDRIGIGVARRPTRMGGSRVGARTDCKRRVSQRY